MKTVVPRRDNEWEKLWPEALLCSASASLVLLGAIEFVVLEGFDWHYWVVLIGLFLIGIVGMVVKVWKRKNSSSIHKREN